MADIQVTIVVAPQLLCHGTEARIGDKVIIVLDDEKYPDSSQISGEITGISETKATKRGCPDGDTVCAKEYEITIDDSSLPDGVTTIATCDVDDIWCADCCELWNRMEHVKVILQPEEVSIDSFYTQIRAVEDLDIYKVGIWIDEWPSVYGDPGPHTDLVSNLNVSIVGGNSASADLAGTETVLLRDDAETFKITPLATPIRIEAGRQIYLKVTDDGGTVPPKGLGIVIFYRRANE